MYIAGISVCSQDQQHSVPLRLRAEPMSSPLEAAGASRDVVYVQIARAPHAAVRRMAMLAGEAPLEVWGGAESEQTSAGTGVRCKVSEPTRLPVKSREKRARRGRVLAPSAAKHAAAPETVCSAHQQLHGAAVADRGSVVKGGGLEARGGGLGGQIRTRPLATRSGSNIFTLVEAGRVALLGAAAPDRSAESGAGAKAEADAAKATRSPACAAVRECIVRAGRRRSSGCSRCGSGVCGGSVTLVTR